MCENLYQFVGNANLFEGFVVFAVLDGANLGIEFGAEGLKISMQDDRPRRATSRLGSYYAKTPSGGRTLFGAADGPKGAQLVDLKVRMHIAGGPGVVLQRLEDRQAASVHAHRRVLIFARRPGAAHEGCMCRCMLLKEVLKCGICKAFVWRSSQT